MRPDPSDVSASPDQAGNDVQPRRSPGDDVVTAEYLVSARQHPAIHHRQTRSLASELPSNESAPAADLCDRNQHGVMADDVCPSGPGD